MAIENEDEGIDITRYIVRFLKTLRWTWLPILILSLLFGGFRYYRAARSFRPVYETRAILSVTSDYSTNDIFTGSNFYNTTAAE